MQLPKVVGFLRESGVLADAVPPPDRSHVAAAVPGSGHAPLCGADVVTAVASHPYVELSQRAAALMQRRVLLVGPGGVGSVGAPVYGAAQQATGEWP